MSTAPVMKGQIRISDPRRLLVERAAVLLRRVFRSVGHGFALWKWQAGKNLRASKGGGLGAVMGRALATRGARSRMLAVEERLTLGPKQHMYLIRCGGQRLLVASAGDAALQWMALPEEGTQREAEACGNTQCTEKKSGAGTKRRTRSAAATRKSSGRSGTRKAQGGEAAVEEAR